MAQIAILSGIYSDAAADFRTSYPRNRIPVPKTNGISDGYLRPCEGILQTGTGPGVDRGGINWSGTLYRVMGTSLCTVSKAGVVTVLGDVGGSGPVSMDYSFNRLGIASGGKLWYWNGTALTFVSDPDIGTVNSVHWIGGYFMTTDGTNVITTDIADPASVNALHYGSAESDPDPIMATDELRNEAYWFGRYTIEVGENIGGNVFPFQRIDGAQVTKGCIGGSAYCSLGNTFVFVGSGRGEAPAVYQMVPGDVQKISTREIDTILLGYTEVQLSGVRMETRVDKSHQHVLIHLPDQCLVYDTIASTTLQMPVWFTMTSSVTGLGQYRATGLVWCYDQWNVADPAGTGVGILSDDVATHWGEKVGWEFGTAVTYMDGNDGIVHELELVTIPGRVALGDDPVVWTSYSADGLTWSQERPKSCGKQGERTKRLAWRTQGKISHVRMQKFRGTSDAHVSCVRLEAQIEPLFTKAMNYG